jgi:hypothetical protein
LGSSFRGRKTVNNCWDDEELEGGEVSWVIAVLIASSTKVVDVDGGRVGRGQVT